MQIQRRRGQPLNKSQVGHAYRTVWEWSLINGTFICKFSFGPLFTKLLTWESIQGRHRWCLKTVIIVKVVSTNDNSLKSKMKVTLEVNFGCFTAHKWIFANAAERHQYKLPTYKERQNIRNLKMIQRRKEEFVNETMTYHRRRANVWTTNFPRVCDNQLVKCNSWSPNVLKFQAN